MKKIITILLLSFLLVSCGGADISVDEEKKDFFIETQSFDAFNNIATLVKTGKLTSTQNINLNSQATGRVSNILVKEGDVVKKGQLLASLEDNIMNYGINLDRAKNALERSKINYDSTELALNKAIEDSKLNLEKLEYNYAALKQNTEQNIKKAKNDFVNSDYENLDSESALNLQKLDNTIEKMELDYENTLISNNETIEGYLSTIKKDHNNLLILIDDVVEYGDTLLGVTNLNDDVSDSIKDYLGAKDTAQKAESKNKLLTLINFKKGDFSSMDISNTENIVTYLNTLSTGFDNTKDFLNSIEQTLNNSIQSEGSLSSTSLTGYTASVNQYQSTLQSYYSAFISFDNVSKSFLRTYKNSEASGLKQIELTKKDREILFKSLSSGGLNAEVGYNSTLINSEDSLLSMEIQVKNAKNTLQNAIDNKSITLRSLNNAIEDASIAYRSAGKEYSKLSITSPINGVISEVLIDEGTEITIGTPVFKLLNTGDNEVSISFNKKELDFVEIGMDIYLDIEGKTYTGSIYSLSNTADSNLKYISRVQFSDDIDFLGNIVSINIPVKVEYSLLPINIVKIKDGGLGTVNIFENGVITQKDVVLGNIYGDKVEIKSGLEGKYSVIMNYVDNFDDEKFILKLKETEKKLEGDLEMNLEKEGARESK